MTDEILPGVNLAYARTDAPEGSPAEMTGIRAARPMRRLTEEERQVARAKRAQALLARPPRKMGRPRSPDIHGIRPPRLTPDQMRQRMAALSLSQSQLARLMGRSRSAMQKILAREVVPDYVSAYLELLQQFDAQVRRLVPMEELKLLVFNYHQASAAGPPTTVEGCAWRLGLPVGVVSDVIEALKAEGVLV